MALDGSTAAPPGQLAESGPKPPHDVRPGEARGLGDSWVIGAHIFGGLGRKIASDRPRRWSVPTWPMSTH